MAQRDKTTPINILFNTYQHLSILSIPINYKSMIFRKSSAVPDRTCRNPLRWLRFACRVFLLLVLASTCSNFESFWVNPKHLSENLGRCCHICTRFSFCFPSVFAGMFARPNMRAVKPGPKNYAQGCRQRKYTDVLLPFCTTKLPRNLS